MDHTQSSTHEGSFQKPCSALGQGALRRLDLPRADRPQSRGEELRTWAQLPRGRLSAVDDNILTLAGDVSMPLGLSSPRMTVVRLKDGGLVIFNAITLDEDEMRQLEAFGTPAWLIVPSDRHRLEAKVWKNRYPALRVVAPEAARERVAEFVAVDATQADFGDPAVRLIDLPGAHGAEAALEVITAHGVTLVVNELVGNIRSEIGIESFLLRAIGFPAEPSCATSDDPDLFDRRLALADRFQDWATCPDLTRIVVTHGEIIEDDPRGVLRWLAAELIAA
jgi:hypothetical protein